MAEDISSQTWLCAIEFCTVPGWAVQKFLSKSRPARQRASIYNRWNAVWMVFFPTMQNSARPIQGPCMEQDPGETINRIHDPALAAVLEAMRTEMLKWLQRTADVGPCAKKSSPPACCRFSDLFLSKSRPARQRASIYNRWNAVCPPSLRVCSRPPAAR